MKNKLIEFSKMTGSGNDFIIIDAMTEAVVPKGRAEFAKKICDRHFGAGADGVFFLEKAESAKNHFKWDFYNADGSNAEMCGNGSRCVARFAYDQKIAPAQMKFETRAGVVGAKVNGTEVEVEMTKPKIIFKSVDVPTAEGSKVAVGYWDTGVPHVVLNNDDWDDGYLNEMGSYLRNYPAFKKTNGANATFFEIVGPSQVLAATFERGVEAVTLACGTGAVAAAAQAVLLGQKPPLKVQMPGGLLSVDFGPDFSFAKLTGPAHYIYTGQLSDEVAKSG